MIFLSKTCKTVRNEGARVNVLVALFYRVVAKVIEMGLQFPSHGQ